jgi:hypothetical protein
MCTHRGNTSLTFPSPGNQNQNCYLKQGFKGRKGEGCHRSSHKKSEEYSGEFSVSQEQINAWLRINGSKPSGRGQVSSFCHLSL